MNSRSRLPLLGGWWRLGLLALVAFLPFFGMMRYMEKQAARE